MSDLETSISKDYVAAQISPTIIVSSLTDSFKSKVISNKKMEINKVQGTDRLKQIHIKTLWIRVKVSLLATCLLIGVIGLCRCFSFC